MAPPPKQSPGQPFFDRRGRLLVQRRGLPRSLGATLAKDGYHWLRAGSWTQVIAVFAAVYLIANLVFALALYVGGAEIMNAHGFADCYWFSLQTMATIGYGYLAPVDTFAHVVVAIESFVGILLTATVTGVFFAKFATPSVRVMFSEVAIIADHEGTPTLTFRVANERATAIVEATVRVSITREEILSTGEHVRRVYDLALRRNTSPVFALSWTVYHPIDSSSPLHGATAESMARENANIFVTFTGIDDSLAAAVHSRFVYVAEQIHFDELYADIIHRDADGNRYLDYAYFDQTRPAPAIASAGPRATP